MALRRVTLSDPSGIEVEVVDLGAAIDVIRSPDRHGEVEPVTLSLPDASRADAETNPFAGVTIGPYANRLVVGDEVVLHGGPDGWCWQTWAIHEATPHRAVFRLGDASAAYTLAEGVLTIELEAVAAVERPLSMTNHTYWNLGGPLHEHVLSVDTSAAVPVDDRLVPAGPPEHLDEPVGLPADLDTCFMIDGVGHRRHARLSAPATGRAVEVWSDHPALQVYTGCTTGDVGTIALEPQHVPNAPALDWAPDPTVAAGCAYRHHLAFRFGTDGDQR